VTYVTLGPRPVKAAADTTGQNAGNWTAVLDDSVIQSSVPEFEMYHMFISAPTLGTNQQSNARVMLNQAFWDATLIAQLNSWDPSQPMLCRPGDTIYVLFNVPTSTTPAPVVTCWFRYQE
jgi:hypothetical protein